MKHKFDRSAHPFPVAQEEQEIGPRASKGSIDERRGLNRLATWPVVGAIVLIIVGLVVGWFGHQALGWFALLFLAVCLGAFAFIAVLSFGRGRKR